MYAAEARDQGRERERLKRQLYLLHAATGHCSTQHLVAALKRRNASAEVIKLAEEFKCSICEERKRVMPRHVASLEPLPPKFHTVVTDVGHWYHPGLKEHCQFLVAIDEGSRFRVAKIVSRAPNSSLQEPHASSFYGKTGAKSSETPGRYAWTLQATSEAKPFRTIVIDTKSSLTWYPEKLIGRLGCVNRQFRV